MFLKSVSIILVVFCVHVLGADHSEEVADVGKILEGVDWKMEDVLPSRFEAQAPIKSNLCANTIILLSNERICADPII